MDDRRDRRREQHERPAVQLRYLHRAALRGRIAKHGRGRVALIENRDRLRDIQSRELEQPAKPAEPGPAGIQPDFALYGKVMDLPNRGTNYYLMQMTVTDLQTRQQVWTGDYEVKVAR